MIPIFASAIQGARKTLVLREIPESKVSNALSNKDYLAACDIAVFVYDRYGAKCVYLIMLCYF